MEKSNKRNIVKEKSYVFALRVVKLCKYLQEQEKEFVLSKQLLKSGTAPGALIREAEQAESRKDFIHKLSIALKEANESIYWLDLLEDSGYVKDYSLKEIKDQGLEVLKLLISIVKTSKSSTLTL